MSNSVTREEMKQEAIRRLRLLGINDDAIGKFIEYDLIPVSDSTLLYCGHIDRKNEPWRKMIDNKFNILTYLIIMDYCAGISVSASASVSEDPDNWERETLALQQFIEQIKYS